MSFHDLGLNISSVWIGQFKYVNTYLAFFSRSFPWVFIFFLLLWMTLLIFVDCCWYMAYQIIETFVDNMQIWAWPLYLFPCLATLFDSLTVLEELWTPCYSLKNSIEFADQGSCSFSFQVWIVFSFLSFSFLSCHICHASPTVRSDLKASIPLFSDKSRHRHFALDPEGKAFILGPPYAILSQLSLFHDVHWQDGGSPIEVWDFWPYGGCGFWCLCMYWMMAHTLSLLTVYHISGVFSFTPTSLSRDKSCLLHL